MVAMVPLAGTTTGGSLSDPEQLQRANAARIEQLPDRQLLDVPKCRI